VLGVLPTPPNKYIVVPSVATAKREFTVVGRAVALTRFTVVPSVEYRERVPVSALLSPPMMYSRSNVTR
jgi:hypothetical protein